MFNFKFELIISPLVLFCFIPKMTLKKQTFNGLI